MEIIELSGEIIRLGQLLKLVGWVDNGGEAKSRIQGGEVRVNGKVETRRGCQLQDRDRVEFAGRQLEVRYLEPASPRGENP